MNTLGKEARELLDTAANANRAPPAARVRGRHRLLGALATGSVSTTALLAEGAWAGTQGAVAGTGAASTTSLLGTLMSAMIIGLSTGLVAVSPASQTQATPAVVRPVPTTQATPTVVRPVPTQPRTAPKAHEVVSVAQLEPVTLAPPVPVPAPTRRTPVEATTAAELAERAPLPSRIPQPPQDLLTSGSESRQPVEFVPAPAVRSIARETEILAQVQRALKGGRAWIALHLLDQYREEFPSGVLHEEAMASRVVALCALERLEEARRWTDAFTRHYPGSPLTGRVRGACQKATAPSPAEPDN